MSSTILKIIPANPTYVPDNIQQEKAKIFLSKLFSGDQIELIVTDTIEFVDQGENFESVSCNLCGQIIEIEQWQDIMEQAYEKQFVDLKFITTCCHQSTTLNDLIYHSEAGFSKFTISIDSPQNEVGQNDLDELRQILGTPLRVICAHY